MTISCMRMASVHNYRNSLFIVELAMVQIPRSTERIFSLIRNLAALSLMQSFLFSLLLDFLEIMKVNW